MIQETWDNMMSLQIPEIEKIIRPIVVYLFLIALFRLFGRRELAQLNPMDLTVLLMLSNTVQNAIIGDDNSLVGGIYGAIALLSANWLVNAATYRSPRLAGFLEGPPKLLVKDGEINQAVMESEKISRLDFAEALHREGLERVEHVRKAHLEPSGEITIIPQEDERIDELLKRLTAIEALLRDGGQRSHANTTGDA